MNEALQLQKLRDELSRHEVLKGSSLAGANWKSKKAELEKEFFNLRVSLIDAHIEGLQNGKRQLEDKFKRGECIWQ